MNVELKNFEIKNISKIVPEYNQKSFALTQNNNKIYPKEDEIEIRKIKMKKFSATNNNFKLSKEKEKEKNKTGYNNIKYRQNTFNKLKNKKIDMHIKIKKQLKGQKSTIINPQEINKEITIPNTFSQKMQTENKFHTNEKNINLNKLSNIKKTEEKKIAKNLSRENMYINSNNINNTFNNFLFGGTHRKKISFKEFNNNKQKNNKILKLYNINNNIYNDEITLINSTNINDIYTTNFTTKNNNNRNNGKNDLMGSGNKIKKNKKLHLFKKYKNNIEHIIFNPSMKIDTNYINNLESNSILNNNIKKLEIRSGEKKKKNNYEILTGNHSKKNVIKNIKDIIIENSNKNNLNLIHSFKSEVNIHNTKNEYNTFNTNESRKKDSKRKDYKNKINNLKISQRGSNYNDINEEINYLSCKNNKNKLKNKVIKLKDVNKNFNQIINNGMKFNSTVKNSSNKNIYITYINNTSSSKNNNINKKTSNNYFTNFHINKSNSNLMSNSNLSKEKLNNRNSLIKLNTLQNEEYVKKHSKNISNKSKINFSPPKIPFIKEKLNNKLHMKLKHPYSNKHLLNPLEKINYSPKINSIPKYVKTENNIANINIMNNNNIFIDKFDFLDNYAISTRKDNIFSKINNYILKGQNSKNNFINLLNRRKLSDKKEFDNGRCNSLMRIIDIKEKEKEKILNKKRQRKIEYNNDTINNTNINKNSLFNYGANTTKNLYKKELLNNKYSFINILKPKAINKLKRYTHNKTKEEKVEERIMMNSLKKDEKKSELNIQENSKLTSNNNKSLTFIYKEKKKNITSLLKQKNMVKLIHMLDELNLNNSKYSKSKSKKKNKSSQHINFMAMSSKKSSKNKNNKFTEDKNIIENVVQNNMSMYSIYIISKYENNFAKIGIKNISLYDINNKEISILYSNSNINTENKDEDNINYLFNEKNKPFISEFKDNLYINFFISIKKADNLKYIKILNYKNQNEEISPVKEIKIYHEQKKLFYGILSINCENVIDISEFNKINKSQQNIPKITFIKKRGNSASNTNNKTNIYNINYINYKKTNNNVRSYSTFRQNSGKKINKIPKKQIVKIKSDRNISPKEQFIKISNMYNNTEINEDTYYDNNNIIIYNICNTIPYNNYNEINEAKDEIYIKERCISDNDLEQSNNNNTNINNSKSIHEGVNLNKLNLNNIINNTKINSNLIKFKIIRLVLSSNYGHNNSIGLTGLEFYDNNNELINIETAETIGALPKDLHTVYNDPNDNRIFENIFNGENNSDDSFNMWLTSYDNINKEEKNLPYIEMSFNKIIYLSKIKFYNYNHLNQLDKCLKTVDIFLDNKFYDKITLRQGLGTSITDNIINKEYNDNKNIKDKNNDYSQDITFPINNEYYENINKNRNKYENIIYNEEKGLDLDYASLKYKQCYETPFLPNGFIIRFQLINNFHQGKNSENNINNKITTYINNISIRNNNYIGINISSIYDQNGNDILLQKDIKYKIVSNKEIIILGENKYIIYYASNDDNNNLYFLFDIPINISYIEIKPFSFSDKEEHFINSVKDIKIFCDTSVIFEGQLYQFHPTSILFTSDKNIFKNININENYLTKYQLNREYKEIKNDTYFSLSFT